MARDDTLGGERVRVIPYGTGGKLVDLDLADHPERAERTLSAQKALEASFSATEVVPGAGTVALFSQSSRGLGEAEILACLRGLAPRIVSPKFHEIPVVYDGPDLEELAGELTLSPREIVALHTARDYLCELVGFMPGFAYLTKNPYQLTLPRRATPRPRVPAGSVALASTFSGIYPFESPGGWHWIGRSLGPTLFDPTQSRPSLFGAGDRVRFVAVDPNETSRSERTLDIRLSLRRRPDERGLLILEAPPLTSLQDVGRPGGLSQGLPRSGPLSPSLWWRAMRAAGSAEGAAGLEIVGGSALVRAVGRIRIGVDDGSGRVLEDGESWRIPRGAGWVRYLAIEEGFAGERILGSRATLVTARLGGYRGGTVKRGDFLPCAEDEVSGVPATPEAGPLHFLDDEETSRVFVDPGPHAHHFEASALERLFEHEYAVSALSNRVGQRLIGPKVERISRDALLPTPMIRGAIEVPVSGEPIVLGPDHPTTGGYPVLAVLRPESWNTVGRLGPGARLRFALAR